MIKRLLNSAIIVLSVFCVFLPATLVAAAEEGWLWPVISRDNKVYTQISWPMTENRNGRPHYAIDIPNSNYVVATKSGSIAYVQNKDNGREGRGIYVIIEHYDKDGNPNYYSSYSHLRPDSLGDKIVKGEYIKQGEVIATAWSTGILSNPDTNRHLHFEVGTKLNSNKTDIVSSSTINVNPNEESMKSLTLQVSSRKSFMENTWRGERMQYIFSIPSTNMPELTSSSDSAKVPGTNNIVTELDYIYYATKDDVPVRATPYANDTILERLKDGTAVKVTGYGMNSMGNLWYRVKINNQERWIFSDNLISVKPVDTTGWQTASKGDLEKVPGTDNDLTPLSVTFYAVKDDVPVRATPYSNDTILQRFKKGTAVKVTGRGVNSSGNLWYRVDINGQERWIFRDNLTSTKPTGK